MSCPPPLRQLIRGTAPERLHARRYWLEDPLVAAVQYLLMHLFRWLPIDWASDFGAWGSRLSPRRYPASDARARRAWARLRPEADPTSTDDAMRRIWRSTGRMTAEIAMLDRIWEEGRITVQGAEHMAAARAAGRPILVAAVHLGNWDAIWMAGLRLGYNGASVAIPMDNRFAERMLTGLRRRYGGRAILAVAASVPAMVRELRERGPLVLYMDGLVGDAGQALSLGRDVPPGGNLIYAVRLAKITGAAIIPAYCTRVGDAARFEVNFLPEVVLPRTARGGVDIEAGARCIDALFDPIVRRHLDQWFYLLDLEV